MSKHLPLILTVADLAYSHGEYFDLLSPTLSKQLEVIVQSVPLADVVEIASRLIPDLIVIGHRPWLDEDTMQRWKAAGSPMGGDIVKALKASSDTSAIPVLMLEAVDEQVARECGADAFVQVPTGPQQIVRAVRALIEKDAVSGG